MEYTRRDLLRATTGFAAGLMGPRLLHAQIPSNPAVTGNMVGDVVPGKAIVWARADRPSRMLVTWKTSRASSDVRRIVGPYCIDVSDYTGRLELTDLPAGQTILYDVQFEDLRSPRKLSEPVRGSFRTPSDAGRDIVFLWSADEVGQGWGINPEWGGMKIFENMRQRQPDFFIHSGDTIYADNPVHEEVRLADGPVWRNLVTEQKSKVAETLDEFRGNYRYNLMDANRRRFNAEVPQIWQWDDHEVINNWSPGTDLSADNRYTEKNVPLLVARAKRAFVEYAPLRFSAEETDRIYRRIPYGPLLDIFVIDMRSYRGPNSYNRQTAQSDQTAFLGIDQVAWLKRDLKASTATWKVIAADMPLGLVVRDGKDEHNRERFENSANGDGPASGRELEIAGLLRFIKSNRILNVVWLTADTHYTAAHYYDPSKAQFSDFNPFWEFMSGPLNAGTFGPNPVDNTFGIQVVYQKAPPPGSVNLPPSAGMQFFGEVRISSARRDMTVILRDLSGAALFTQVLEAKQS